MKREPASPPDGPFPPYCLYLAEYKVDWLCIRASGRIVWRNDGPRVETAGGWHAQSTTISQGIIVFRKEVISMHRLVAILALCATAVFAQTNRGSLSGTGTDPKRFV